MFLFLGRGGVLINEAGEAAGALTIAPNSVTFGAVAIGQTTSTKI